MLHIVQKIQIYKKHIVQTNHIFKKAHGPYLILQIAKSDPSRNPTLIVTLALDIT